MLACNKKNLLQLFSKILFWALAQQPNMKLTPEKFTG